MSDQPTITYKPAPTITFTEVLQRLKAHIEVIQDGNGKWRCGGTIEWLHENEDEHISMWLPIDSLPHPLPEQAVDTYIAVLRNHRLRNRVGDRSSWSLVRSSPYVYLDLTRCILEDYKPASRSK